LFPSCFTILLPLEIVWGVLISHIFSKIKQIYFFVEGVSVLQIFESGQTPQARLHIFSENSISQENQRVRYLMIFHLSTVFERFINTHDCLGGRDCSMQMSDSRSLHHSNCLKHHIFNAGVHFYFVILTYVRFTFYSFLVAFAQ
jgi:hypothetical protein